MGSENNKKLNWRRYFDFNEVARYADSHNREIQITIYALGATGLLIAVRSLRLFTKFTSVNKIPDSFFRKQIKLNGFVRSVEGGERATLNVEHIPIVELTYHKNVRGLLPVRLAGVGPWREPLASKYVADQVLNKRITFQLVQEGPKEEYLFAGVFYQPYRFLPNRSLNADLVENDLAPYIFEGTQTTVVETDPKTGKVTLFQPQPVDRKLAERMMRAHRVAQKRKEGLWRLISGSKKDSESESSLTIPSKPDRISTVISATSATFASITRALRYGASAVVFLPAQVKDKIMQRRLS